ncbi:hypothetical protein GOBAR_AA35417 [Gossypium barbadense]|uniref:Uncharacterized protein n=1 Tax=Gossypium barbadense TaxID=3634 RepID=A0A2P5W2I0_GOSBA|nr:hypothetical protein GOBAR_AA35417 [Gossypium barbadense]
MAYRYLNEGERADALEWLRIIKVGHDVLNMECRAKFKCELKPTGLVQALSSQFSSPHLKVGPVGFGIALPDFRVEIRGMGGEFPR